jgi:RNA polymerase sigma-70 factor (ECF subfamily)
MEADPDAELMLRLKNGEDSILNEFMTRWQQPLVTFIYRYIGRQSDSLDLVQETFLRLYEMRRRYTVQSRFSTWLFAIAANLGRHHLRSRQRRRESVPKTRDAETADLAESIPGRDDSPDQTAMRSESISLIKAAIDRLRDDLKTVILLYECQSLSYAEISSVLKAVEMKLYRARQLLRERLAGSDLR